MDPITILATVNTAITVATKLYEMGKDAAPIVKSLWTNITQKGDNVTKDDLDRVIEDTDRLYKQFIEIPIPDEEE